MLNDGEHDRNCLECWTLLTAIAVEVKDIRIGSLVTCASYRNPALLAKMAASLDQVSGGRLEFGIGAGWKDVEYEAYGYRFPSAGDRVSQLEESIKIIKSLWTEPTTTFDGEFHSEAASSDIDWRIPATNAQDHGEVRRHRELRPAARR
jgi:alkanesulfonate monooxygenase SsuD/methylene tetrahydromethanopterin reductase-like flavin-dependent oxidoreductase (luciferase family)